MPTFLVRLATLVAFALAFVLPSVSPAAAHASAPKKPHCQTAWGSAPETAGGITPVESPITRLSAGRHACFDRFVVTVAGTQPAPYDVRYVPVITGTDDRAHALRGNGDLQVTVFAPAHDDAFNPTITGVPSVRGFTALRQVKLIESFEGVSVIGLGTRGKLPFRVFTLAGPDNSHRVVVDVAHRW